MSKKLKTANRIYPPPSMPHNILLIQLGDIGDVVLTTPTVRAVKETYPGARVSILFFNGLETAWEATSLIALFDPRIGPGSVLGGVTGAYIGGYIAARAIGKDGCACDAFAPAMALAMGIGRIGAFLAGVDGLGSPPTCPGGSRSRESIIQSIRHRFTTPVSTSSGSPF
jgi:hypothetical protein